MQLLLPEHTNKNVSMIPLPRGGNTHGGNAVADRANHVLSQDIPAGKEDDIIWIQGMVDELQGLTGHDFWKEFKRVGQGLCNFSWLFKQEEGASRTIATNFITALNTVALRDVETSFTQKRGRGDDGFDPLDKKRYYAREYDTLHEKILQAYGHDPEDASLQEELQSLRKTFSDQLEARVEQYESAEGLDYLMGLYENIPNGIFGPGDTKEKAYHAFEQLRRFIYRLENGVSEGQSSLVRLLPFLPGDFPFTMDLEGIKQLRDAFAIAWAKHILENTTVKPSDSLYYVTSAVDNELSRLGVDLEGLGYTVRETKQGIGKMLGRGTTVGYELKKLRTSEASHSR